MNESQRLCKLVNNLLLLTKLEHNYYGEIHNENISNIIKEVIQYLDIIVKYRKLDLNNDIYCEINKYQIKQVIYKLAQISIKYIDNKTGTIKIIMTKKESIDYVKIDILDNGECIYQENIDLVFDRLFRYDKHRSRKNSGY